MDQGGKDDVVVSFGPPHYKWECKDCHRVYQMFLEAYDCARGCTKTPLTEEERAAQRLDNC